LAGTKGAVVRWKRNEKENHVKHCCLMAERERFLGRVQSFFLIFEKKNNSFSPSAGTKRGTVVRWKRNEKEKLHQILSA
jgi:hypothetical protein